MKARISIIATLALLCGILVAAPASAATPFFWVDDGWGGAIWGDGWPGDAVVVSVLDADGTPFSEATIPLEPGGTFGAGLGLDDASGAGWEIVVSGDGVTKSLTVPLLAIDRVDTALQSVTGTADPGLDIVVSACVDTSNGPSCYDMALNGAPATWSVGPLDVDDRTVRARTVDDDGDRFQTTYRWPNLNYVRDTGITSGHRLEGHGWPVGAQLTVTVVDPAGVFDGVVPAEIGDDGGFWVDLTALGIPVGDVGQWVVGDGWSFAAETLVDDGSVDGWTMRKHLAVHDVSVDLVDQQSGSATGTCSTGVFHFSVHLNRGEWWSDPGEDYEGLCTSGTWSLNWDVEPFAVPSIAAGINEFDDDGVSHMDRRESISVGSDLSVLSLGLHEWDLEEETTLTVSDGQGTSVWSGVIDGFLQPMEGEPGRADAALAELFDATQVVDGWTFVVESATQLKAMVFETVTIDLDGDGLIAFDESGMFTGTAPANRLLYVGWGPDRFTDVWSNEFGTWEATIDLGDQSEIQVNLPDPDGDGVGIAGLVFPDDPEPEPRVMVTPQGDTVRIEGWPDPQAVMVWADGAEPVEVWEEDHGISFWFDVDIVAGSFIEATDGETTKTHVVYDLGVYSVEGSVVTGYGPSDRILSINIDTENGFAVRAFEPNADGTFSVDFNGPWDIWGDGYLDEIVLGTLNLDAHDDDNDGTVYGIDPLWFELQVDQGLVAVGDALMLGGLVRSTAPGDGYEAQIDWGDGTAETVVFTNDGPIYGPATLAAEHIYGAAGVFPVVVTVDLGGEVVEEGTEIAVFDPNGGFFTGSGRLLLPEGAYAGDPAATGKATFRLTSKYKKDGTLKGSVQLDFRPGDVKFRSTVLDVMIVSPGLNAVAGQGTINGEGEFGFVAFVGDGDPDTLQLLVFGPGAEGEDEVLLIDTGAAPELVRGAITIVYPHSK